MMNNMNNYTNVDRGIRRGGYVVIGISCILLAYGIAVIGVGAWMLSDTEFQTIVKLTKNIPSDTNRFGRLVEVTIGMLTALGVLVFLVPLLGIFAAWQKNKGLLIIFAGSLGLVMLYQIAYVTVSSIAGGHKNLLRDNLPKDLETGYTSTFTNTSSTWTYSSSNELSKALDVIQVYKGCCGMDSPKDFGVNSSVPYTCCSYAESDSEIKSMNDVIWSGSGDLKYVGSKCYVDEGCLEYVMDIMDTRMGFARNMYHGLWALEGILIGNAVMLSRYLARADGTKM